MEQVSKVAKLFQGEILIQGVLAPYVFHLIPPRKFQCNYMILEQAIRLHWFDWDSLMNSGTGLASSFTPEGKKEIEEMNSSYIR